MESFGQRLVISREKHNLSQKEFAERLGITPTRLNYWEKDKREPSIKMIKLIAQILDIDPNYLIGYQPQNKHKLSPKIAALHTAMSQLNDQGQEKVLEYANDLVATGLYIKSSADGLGKDVISFSD